MCREWRNHQQVGYLPDQHSGECLQEALLRGRRELQVHQNVPSQSIRPSRIGLLLSPPRPSRATCRGPPTRGPQDRLHPSLLYPFFLLFYLLIFLILFLVVFWGFVFDCG